MAKKVPPSFMSWLAVHSTADLNETRAQIESERVELEKKIQDSGAASENVHFLDVATWRRLAASKKAYVRAIDEELRSREHSAILCPKCGYRKDLCMVTGGCK